MPSSSTEPITIAVGDGVSVSGLLQSPPRARACYVLAHGAGAGMTHPFMAAVAAGLAERGIATLALPVPLHGARQQAARSAEAGACRGARRGGRGRAALAEAAAHRRRQIVRRPDDLAGAGRGAAAGRARTGVPRLSAASGEAAVARARQASVRRANPDAVPARHARRAGDARSARAAVPGARRAGDACGCSRTPIIRSTCRRAAAARTRRS